ncbi:BapA/Bap/LapF family prefix-like domain-containing protein, partial [Brevundimonas diminuta]|uniref:BapA/Bap/LapF family prefix-like domain-containing protein n=1 Tax=Brevundimonas diminuta TaxID=293 RepID=UPI00320952A1
MHADIIDKKSGSRRQVEDGQPISSNRPSVFRLKLAPESVARYVRRGDDLVLVLKDGQEIVILAFFVKYPDGDSPEDVASTSEDASNGEEARNDLVLEDDYGVVWWGQYPEEWSEFHFTEIELDHVAGVVWWPWVLGLVAGGTAIAAVANGGGDGGKGKPPVAVDDSSHGTEDGGPVTGNVLTNDSDPDGDTLSVVSFTIAGVPGVHDAGDTVTIPGAGVFTLAADGGYSFTPAANWNG